MGTYQMTIGCDINGAPLIGARACRDCDAVDTDRIYPSQMEYRIVARLGRGAPVIMTRTEARELGLPIIAEFPRADGSMSAR